MSRIRLSEGGALSVIGYIGEASGQLLIVVICSNSMKMV